MQLSRLQFKRMVSAEFAQIMSLHAGEAYAVQNLTRTDRLALLLSGKVCIHLRILLLNNCRSVSDNSSERRSALYSR